jgi:hypothetical protein
VASERGDRDDSNASGFGSLAPILAELFPFEIRQNFEKNETLAYNLVLKMTQGHDYPSQSCNQVF